jgi:hypothetical protein
VTFGGEITAMDMSTISRRKFDAYRSRNRSVQISDLDEIEDSMLEVKQVAGSRLYIPA